MDRNTSVETSAERRAAIAAAVADVREIERREGVTRGLSRWVPAPESAGHEMRRRRRATASNWFPG